MMLRRYHKKPEQEPQEVEQEPQEVEQEPVDKPDQEQKKSGKKGR